MPRKGHPRKKCEVTKDGVKCHDSFSASAAGAEHGSESKEEDENDIFGPEV
jgi:hypothetical protein